MGTMSSVGWVRVTWLGVRGVGTIAHSSVSGTRRRRARRCQTPRRGDGVVSEALGRRLTVRCQARGGGVRGGVRHEGDGVRGVVSKVCCEAAHGAVSDTKAEWRRCQRCGLGGTVDRGAHHKGVCVPTSV
jgi:hypothetical protein